MTAGAAATAVATDVGADTSPSSTI